MKIKQLFIKCILSASILIFSSAVLASAESDFSLGVEAFKGGNNADAAKYFESAMHQGLDSVALKYNLASSYYKLGRYREAKKYFNIVNQTVAMRDLAEYNLGLIAIKEKDWSLARRYFNSVVSSGRDKKLTRLSKKHLVALTKKEDKWSGYVSTNLGYDDNLNAVSSDSTLGISDNFYDLFGVIDYLISGRTKDGWVANANLYLIDYSDTSSYDETITGLGIKKSIIIEGWESSALFNFSKSDLAKDDYLTTEKIELKVRKPLNKSERIYMSYSFEDINSEQDIYNYLEGWRQKVRLEYRNYLSKYSSQVYYELELNNRGELVTTSYAYDYSPTRHKVYGKFNYYFNDKSDFGCDLTYRLSDYPTSATVNREDNQWRISLSTNYRFNRTFKLNAKIQWTDNESTEDRYSYEKSIIKVGLSKVF